MLPVTPSTTLVRDELPGTLGTGEALVTVLAPNGTPTPPFAVRMAPLAADELARRHRRPRPEENVR
jgi:hypothetical protein